MIMFAVIFGLSMDYEVFLLSRTREVWLSGRHRKFVGGDGQVMAGRVLTPLRTAGGLVGGSAEVEAAGAGEGFFWAAGEASGGQDLVLVFAAAVEVEREAPDAG